MPADHVFVDPQSFATFGGLLRFLRRRSRLTQRDLGIAVGYSEGHINRFEKDKHLPDSAAVAALFVPALDLNHEPRLAARLIELATPTVSVSPPDSIVQLVISLDLMESIPSAASHEILRQPLLDRVRMRLADERRVALCGLP